MKKQPEQTAHTRQALIDAFWELAEKRGIDKVTISAITKKAHLNRGTFYVYFTDINDLLEQTEEEIIQDLRLQLENSIGEGGFENYEAASEKMVYVFTRYNEKLFLLIGKNGDPNFFARVREIAAEVFSNLLQTPKENPYKDYVIAFATSAFAGLLTYWHESGRNIGINELTAIIHATITKGVSGIISATNYSE